MLVMHLGVFLDSEKEGHCLSADLLISWALNSACSSAQCHSSLTHSVLDA